MINTRNKLWWNTIGSYRIFIREDDKAIIYDFAKKEYLDQEFDHGIEAEKYIKLFLG